MAIVAILIHEIFIFIAIPFLFFWLSKQFNKGNMLKSCSKSLLNLLPTLCTFILVTVFKGTPETVLQIKESWSAFYFPQELLTSLSYDWGAVEAIGFNIEKGLSMPIGFFTCFDTGLYGPIALAFTLTITYVIINNINKLDNTILCCKPKPINTTALSSVLLFQFCSIASLYFIGIDYSRWIYL